MRIQGKAIGHALISCSIISLATGVAHAETSPSTGETATASQEILVTAQRRVESQQKVPVAVTVISPQEINASANFSAADVQTLAPGLTAQTFDGDRNAIYIAIRGQSFTTGTIYPSVIAYFGEVPLTKLPEGSFFDLQNIQVLRGPQGTLFGRVTNGGAILLEPARPTYNLDGFVTQKLGSYDLHTTTAALNVPIVPDVLAVRFAYERGRQTGYDYNITTKEDMDNVHYDTGRIGVLFTPSTTFENLTTINYLYGHDNGSDERLAFVNQPAVIAELSGIYGPAGAAAFASQLAQAASQQVARGPTQTAEDALTANSRNIFYIVNRTKADIAENITLKNTFGYTRFKQYNVADYDGSDLSYIHIVASVYPSTLDDRQQLSDELQLQGNSLNKRLEWTAGAYMDLNQNGGPTQSDVQLFGLFREVTQQDQKATSRALYGQASYSFAGALEGVKARGGLRYTWDKISGDGSSYFGFLGSTGFPNGQCVVNTAALTGLLSAIPCISQQYSRGTLTYTYGLDYQVNPQTLLYAKVSRGYRPGGFNIVPSQYSTSYQPEFDVSHEIGLKGDWNINGIKIRTDIAAFYDNYTDIQERISADIDDETYSLVANGPNAHIYGVEVETTVRPIKEFGLTGRWSHDASSVSTAKYSASYIAAACPADPQVVAPDETKVCPLSKIARMPKDSVELDATVYVPVKASLGALSVTGSFYYVSSMQSIDTNYYDPDSHMDSYNFINANANWSHFLQSKFDLSVFCTNLTNKIYVTSRGSVSEMGNLGIGKLVFGPPRMFGVAVTYHFGG